MRPAASGRQLLTNGVDVKPDKLANLLLRQVFHPLAGEAEALQAALEGRGDAEGAVGVGRAEAAQQRFIRLRGLMEHARVELGGEQVVGGRDGVDVAGEVEVEGLHGDHLGVPAAGSAALDAEGGALSHARHRSARGPARA